MSQNEELPIHYYPDDIRHDFWKDRSITIMVKKNEDLSGNIDEIEKIVENRIKQINDKLNSGSIWSVDTPSDINKTPVIENTKRLNNAKTIYCIKLPLPNELHDIQNHTWEAENGVISSLINSTISAAKKAVTDANTKSDEQNKADGKFAAIAAILKKKNEALEAILKHSPQIVGNASSAFGFRKPVVDPGWFANYQGTKPRIFNLSFDFIPNNAGEANMILNIILNLKKFSSPTPIVTGVALLAPYMFEIRFGNEKLERLINLSNVVLQSVEVNYSGDGSMQFLPNGMPTYIKLNLQFSECNVVTADLY